MLTLLAALLAEAPGWIHGYGLMNSTGLKSGALYPALMRMAELGLVAAEWREPTAPGRPPRHAYRLTAAGLALAHEARAAPAPSVPAGAFA